MPNFFSSICRDSTPRRRINGTAIFKTKFHNPNSNEIQAPTEFQIWKMKPVREYSDQHMLNAFFVHAVHRLGHVVPPGRVQANSLNQ
jgi:hypothetical protein